jgi:uncharacterized protein (TIGR03435 family)
MHLLRRCTPLPGCPSRRLACAACVLLAALMAALCSGAQACVAQGPTSQQVESAAAAAPQFDVAAIHPHDPAPHERSHIISENGRFTTINVDLKSIIQWAYDLPESRIVGGPSWLGSARWDIEAKAENALDTQKTYDSDAARQQKRRMVQSLLADRFHLAAHYETRELPIYELVVAKGGPMFLDTKAEGSKFDRWNGRIELQGGDDTVAVLAEQLAEVLGRVVVDKTGIQGRYKIALKWTPDDRAPSSGSSADDSGPSIFTALEEQLGLKLESGKGSVQVLAIDRAGMPTAN